MIENKKYFPRILIITVNAWNDSISSGNTISNRFGAWDPEKISNIYLRNERIDNKICHKYFRITERDIFKSLFSGKSSGEEIAYDKEVNDYSIFNSKIHKKNKIIEYIKTTRLTSVLFLREIFWAIGFRKKDKLKSFLKDINPEVIHMHCPVHGHIYAHRILHYCQKITNAKVVLFYGDDMYSYKNNWPLDRIYQFILRVWVKKTVKISDLNYAVTSELCEYYSNIFEKEFKLLFKGASLLPPTLKPHTLPLKIVYTGNILWNRWRTLALISKAIEQVSNGGNVFKLEIYTQSAISKNMQLALNTENSQIKNAISYEEVKKTLAIADIVLHVESFTQKYMLITKYSFSTKIVDCIQSGSCIMAVGPDELASINFLKQTNAALVANNYDEICNHLQNIIKNRKKLNEMPLRMYGFAKDKFDINRIRENITTDIIKLIKN